MKEILSAVSFPLLLRNFFAGVVFLLAYLRTLPSDSLAVQSEVLTSSVNLIAIALTIGTLLYAIQRATIEPLYHFLRHHLVGADKYPLSSKSSLEVIRERWNAGVKKEDRAEVYQKRLSEWADYCHLMLTSSLAVALGSWSAALAVGGGFGFAWDLVGGWFLLGASGLLAEFRRHGVMNYIRKHIQED